MALFKKKQLLYRLIMLGLAIFFSAGAMALIFHGSRVYYSASKHQLALGESNGKLMVYIIRIQAETAMARDAFDLVDAPVFKARVQEMVDEADKAAEDLARAYTRIRMRDERDRFLDEMQELTRRTKKMLGDDPVSRGVISEVHEEAVTVERVLIANASRAIPILRQQARKGRAIMYFAGGCLALALIAGAIVCLSVLNETLSGIAGPIDLEPELRKIQETKQFRVRMERISPSTGNSSGPWNLTLYRVLDRHYTHNTFEAVANIDGERVMLWGKSYCWAGFVKSVQRIFWPAYGKASWMALCRMHNYGINTPFPIVLEPVKRNRFRVGQILLVEHVGEVGVLTSFLESHLAVMSPNNRRKLLVGMIGFWNSLHVAGIFGIKARYLHTKDISPENPEKARYYLFDLDKLMVRGKPGRKGFISRILAARDNRRLMKKIAELLTPDELRLVHQMLEKGEPPEEDSPPAAH